MGKALELKPTNTASQTLYPRRSRSLLTLIEADEIVAAAGSRLQNREINQDTFEDELRRARRLISIELKQNETNHKTILHLRRADLLSQDSHKTLTKKVAAATYVAGLLERMLRSETEHLYFKDPRRIRMMVRLAGLAAEKRPDVALRLTAVIEELDPVNPIRDDLSEKLQTIAVAAPLPPPRPGMISPSLVPPRIKR